MSSYEGPPWERTKSATRSKSRKRTPGDVKTKLVDLGQRAVSQIHDGRDPSVEIPLRTLANVKFDPKKSILELGDDRQTRSLFNVGQARKYMQTHEVTEEDLAHTSVKNHYYGARNKNALFQKEITVEKGRVRQSNFDDYPILRLREMPEVKVVAIDSEDAIGGIGEPGYPPLGPAVLNALFCSNGMTGREGRLAPALPQEPVLELLSQRRSGHVGH